MDERRLWYRRMKVLMKKISKIKLKDSIDKNLDTK
jgi:hypothetical protein